MSSIDTKLALLGCTIPSLSIMPEDSDQTDTSYLDRAKIHKESLLWRKIAVENLDKELKNILYASHHSQKIQNPYTEWDRAILIVIQSGNQNQTKRQIRQQLRELLDINSLKDAHLAGLMLAIATEGFFSEAIYCARQIIKNHKEQEINFEVIELFHGLCLSLNTDWHIEQAEDNSSLRKALLLFYCECTHLFKTYLGSVDKITSNENDLKIKKTELLSKLDEILKELDNIDDWIGLPKGKAILLAEEGDYEAIPTMLEEYLPLSMKKVNRVAKANAMSSQLMTELGLWDVIKTRNKNLVKQLEMSNSGLEIDSSTLSIVHAETQLISGELSIALANKSLNSNPEKNISSDQLWRSLSRSQLGQDLWVLEKLNWKRSGYFVEFGATDGVLLSNTWLLEKLFDWNGICAEPNPKFFEKLKNNRSCTTSDECIYTQTGEEVEFIFADVYGGIKGTGIDDKHFDKRLAYEKNGHTKILKTISLNDILEKHNAPLTIDYLSIDTEGSEFDILQSFDWAKYQIRCISVEHNFTEMREKIRSLLKDQGYHECIEKKFDDWYFKNIE